jgi:hypothetical protein
MVSFTIQSWNMPPGGVRMMCPECRGNKAILVARQYLGADGDSGTIAQPVKCPTCKGEGMFPMLEPPA